jgi:hypothetical protein
MSCPHCASTTTTERPDRTALGYRRFRCRSCKRGFNERTGTPFNYLEFPTDVVCLVVLWCYALSLRDLAEMFLQRGIVFTHEAVRGWGMKPTHERGPQASRASSDSRGAGSWSGPAAGWAVTAAYPKMMST